MKFFNDKNSLKTALLVNSRQGTRIGITIHSKSKDDSIQNLKVKTKPITLTERDKIEIPKKIDEYIKELTKIQIKIHNDLARKNFSPKRFTKQCFVTTTALGSLILSIYAIVKFAPIARFTGLSPDVLYNQTTCEDALAPYMADIDGTSGKSVCNLKTDKDAAFYAIWKVCGDSVTASCYANQAAVLTVLAFLYMLLTLCCLLCCIRFVDLKSHPFRHSTLSNNLLNQKEISCLEKQKISLTKSDGAKTLNSIDDRIDALEIMKCIPLHIVLGNLVIQYLEAPYHWLLLEESEEEEVIQKSPRFHRG